MSVQPAAGRTVGLLGATGIGVGAIVGGGILVLAGVAFAETGPSAMIAFGVNGAIAFLTAMSFAEISSRFPESGGAYTFAKKVLSVRAAFAAGWVLWFAYIVAGVLYALGFASFAQLAIGELVESLGGDPPAWLYGRRMALFFATASTVGYAVSLIRRATGGGQWATIGKVIVFIVLIVAGVVALMQQSGEQTTEALTPYFAAGAPGLFAAMGYTFIALQGFDLIAAVAGEVKDPARTIPRAMFYSLGCALIIYLPLLFIVASVGVEEGESIRALSQEHPDTVFAVAVEQYMGKIGYWLVVVAALLSTLSALQANMLAASRVALSMARDRTLPKVLGDVHALRKTPIMAIYATSLTLVAIVFMVPDVAGAGAAASLIFLVSFALAHVTSYLARRRGEPRKDAYQTPWFPAVPIAGGTACVAMAVFQAAVAPVAGAIVAIWLGLGVILYFALFANPAETFDARAQALDPDLVQLRGHRPLVLLPVANPAHAAPMIEVANTLVPARVGRVLLLTIVGRRDGDDPDEIRRRLADAQKVVGEALGPSYVGGHAPEALITTAEAPLTEIRRVAGEHDCESLLLGVSEIADDMSQLEELISDVDCDVAVMNARTSWRLADAKRVLIPIGGRGEQHELRARLLGSIGRGTDREFTFARVLPAGADEEEVKAARRAAMRMAELEVPRGKADVVVLRSDDIATALVEEANKHDLVVLGLRRIGGRGIALGDVSFRFPGDAPRTVFGEMALRIAREANCAAIMLSRKL